MSVLIGLSLAIIAAILFYRLVERRHKLLIGWVALGLVLLAALGIGSLFAYAQWTNHRYQQQLKSVNITFVPPSPDTALQRKDPVGYYLSRYGPTRQEVTFHICNTGKDTVTGVTFYPKAVSRGRSTQHDLEVSRPGSYSTNTFESDYILPPRECADLTWNGGTYKVLDSIVAEPTYVTVR